MRSQKLYVNPVRDLNDKNTNMIQNLRCLSRLEEFKKHVNLSIPTNSCEKYVRSDRHHNSISLCESVEIEARMNENLLLQV